MDYFRFLSCSNVQILWWYQHPIQTFDLTVFNSLHAFLSNLPCLQNLDIDAPQGLGRDSLIVFVFVGHRSVEYGKILGV